MTVNGTFFTAKNALWNFLIVLKTNPKSVLCDTNGKLIKIWNFINSDSVSIRHLKFRYIHICSPREVISVVRPNILSCQNKLNKSLLLSTVYITGVLSFKFKDVGWGSSWFFWQFAASAPQSGLTILPIMLTKDAA